MQNVLIVTQVIFSILFMLSVLFQEKGSGLSLTFGGGEGAQTFYGSKQGIQKFLAYASYIFASLFVVNAVLYIVLV